MSKFEGWAVHSTYMLETGKVCCIISNPEKIENGYMIFDSQEDFENNVQEDIYFETVRHSKLIIKGKND